MPAEPESDQIETGNAAVQDFDFGMPAQDMDKTQALDFKQMSINDEVKERKQETEVDQNDFMFTVGDNKQSTGLKKTLKHQNEQ